MYVIVVGCGRVGAQLAEVLSSQAHDVVVIDKDKNSFRRLGTAFNGITIEGVGFDSEALKKAGIEKAEALIAVTDLDNTNMMVAEVASKIFKVPKVISRLYNPEKEKTYQELGIDYICGTVLVAAEILDRLIPGRIRHLPLLRETEIVEFEAATGAFGKKFKDLELPGEFKVVGVLRNGKSEIPLAEGSVKEKDIIVGVAKSQALKVVQKYSKTKLF